MTDDLDVRPLLVSALSLALLVTACQSSNEPGSEPLSESQAWTTLFAGEDLQEWHNPYDWGEAWVEDGEIHLRASEKFFLVTDDSYGDFVLEADVRVPDLESNSGIMFRAHVDTNRVWGYQAEVDPSERAWSGGLYDEGRRGWLHPAEGDSAAGARFREGPGRAFEPGGWNEYRIRAEGDSLEIRVNGTRTTAYRDTVDARGHIGLQHHGEEGKIYRFREVRIREL